MPTCQHLLTLDNALAEELLAEAPADQTEEQSVAVKRALEQLQAKTKKAGTEGAVVSTSAVASTAELQHGG